MGELTLSDEFITEAVNKYSDTIIDSVMKLPEKYSTVIHLFYYEDMQIKEIAETLNIKQSTVKQRLARREKLKKLLYKEDMYNRQKTLEGTAIDVIVKYADGSTQTKIINVDFYQRLENDKYGSSQIIFSYKD